MLNPRTILAVLSISSFLRRISKENSRGNHQMGRHESYNRPSSVEPPQVGAVWASCAQSAEEEHHLVVSGAGAFSEGPVQTPGKEVDRE